MAGCELRLQLGGRCNLCGALPGTRPTCESPAASHWFLLGWLSLPAMPHTACLQGGGTMKLPGGATGPTEVIKSVLDTDRTGAKVESACAAAVDLGGGAVHDHSSPHVSCVGSAGLTERGQAEHGKA